MGFVHKRVCSTRNVGNCSRNRRSKMKGVNCSLSKCPMLTIKISPSCPKKS